MGEKRFCLPTVREMCEPTMLRGGGRGQLDDLETDQIRALGRVVDKQSINPRTLSIWIDQPEEVAENYLIMLMERGFVRFDDNYYSPTKLGEQCVIEIGKEIATTDLLLLKQYMKNLEKFFNNVLSAFTVGKTLF